MKSVIEWMVDSDPAIRWQVMRDLMDQPDEVGPRVGESDSVIFLNRVRGLVLLSRYMRGDR